MNNEVVIKKICNDGSIQNDCVNEDLQNQEYMSVEDCFNIVLEAVKEIYISNGKLVQD